MAVLIGVAASCSSKPEPSETTASQNAAVTSCGNPFTPHATTDSAHTFMSFGASWAVFVPPAVQVTGSMWYPNTPVTAYITFDGPVTCTYYGSPPPAPTADLPLLSCSNGVPASTMIRSTSAELWGTFGGASGTAGIDAQIGKSPEDTNPCTIDTCSPSGTPSNLPAPNGTSCDTDNDVCNGICTCQSGTPTAGTPLDPDDHSSCTNDTCDPQAGAVNTPNGTCAPASSAPPYGTGTLPSDFSAGAGFLATQNGATAAYDSWRAAIVRGRVTDGAGAALPGVSVSVRGYSFGTASTTLNGYYDLEVNGGETYTLTFTKPGYLPAIRTVKPRWLDFTVVDDVALVQPVDPPIPITPNSGVWQRAVFPSSSDADPLRQPVVLIPPGTTIASGSAPSTWNLRVTEFTVGALGPNRMPADLPAQSAYTYAADFSIDNASEPLTFNQPVIVYLDNFTNNPLSLNPNFQAVDRNIVPVGSLNPTTGKWDADPTNDPTGRVIQIKSISGGLAELSFDGSALMAPGDYTALGITDLERAQVALQYPVQNLPKSVWRIPIKHFCPKDFNWPSDTPDDAVAPPGKEPLVSQPVDNSCKISGSIIECENQTLGESLPIPNTPFSLVYRSVTQNGWHPVIKVPITDERILPSSLQRIETEITVAGVKHVFSTSNKAQNQYVTWTWDRLDAYGRKVQGQTTANVSVAYIYPSKSSAASGFGTYGSGGNNGTRNSRDRRIYRYYEIPIGAIDAQPLGLGGWTLDVQHIYEPRTGVTWWGFGDQRTPGKQGELLTTFSPAGVALFPRQLSSRPEGGFLAAQARTVIKYDAAGVGTALGYMQPENGSTLQPTPLPQTDNLTSYDTTYKVSGIYGVAAGPDDTFYFTEGNTPSGTELSWRVWKVGPAPARLMTLVAGRRDDFAFYTPTCLAVTADGSAAAGNMFHPHALAVGKDGSVFFAEKLPTASSCSGGGGRIVRVSPSGRANVVAGNAVDPPGLPASACQTGLPVPTATCSAKSQPLASVTSLAVADDGSVYFSDARSAPANGQVWRVTPDGLLSHVAGCVTGNNCTGDGATAQTLALTATAAVATKGTNVYVYDRVTSKVVWLIDAAGIARRVAGGGGSGVGTDVPATAAVLSGSNQTTATLAVGTDGTVVGSDDGRLYQFKPFPDVVDPNLSGSKLVPIGTGGSVASFTPSGRLDRTYTSARGKVQYTFGYDLQGRLITITDATATSHPTTTIEYASATTVRIHPAFDTTTSGPGARTSTLTLANGYLQSFAKPDASHVDLVMGATGLLTQLTDENSKVHTFQYTSDGLLTLDKNPLGPTNGTRLTRITRPDAWTVGVTSPAGRVATHTLDRGADPAQPQRLERRHHVSQANLVIDDDLFKDGSRKTTYPAIPNQTSIVLDSTKLDLRYGFGGAYAATRQVTNGSLSYSVTDARTTTPSPPTNPFTLTAEADTYTRTGGADSSTMTRTLTTSTGIVAYVTGGNRRVEQTLDAFDRVSRVEIKGNVPGPAGAPLYPVDFAYDVAGHSAQITQNTRTVTATYDNSGSGYLTSLTTPLGTVSYSNHDSLGRPHAITLPGNRVVGMNYDGAGNVTSVTTPRNTIHTFTPNAINALDTYTPPAGSSPSGNTTYGYDLDSLVTALTKLQTGTATYDRDSAGRFKTVAFPTLAGTQESVAYTYDEAGHRKTINSTLGPTLNYTYDGDRVLQEQYGGTFAYNVNKTYDGLGRLKTRKLGNATSAPNDATLRAQSVITFGYDADGLVNQVQGPSGGLTDRYIITHGTGNPASPLVASTVLDKVSDTYEYDRYGAVSHYTAYYNPGGWTFYEVKYTVRDGAGRVLTKEERINNGAWCTAYYAYDANNFLTSQTGTCPGNGSWTYDANGNRSNGGTLNFDSQDRSLGDGGWNYSFNADGDVTAQSAVGNPSWAWSFTRDLHGALRRVIPPTGSGLPNYTYDVDGLGRRLMNLSNGGQVQGYVWDGGRVVAMHKWYWNIVGHFAYVTKSHVPDYMLVPGGGAWRVISDELGSVRAIIRASDGWTAGYMSYDPWGVPDTGGGNLFGYVPFGFAGGLWDGNVGLYRFGARDYNPWPGRWWSKDRSRFSGGLNFYQYAAGDPVNFIDPTGHRPEVDHYRTAGEAAYAALNDIWNYPAFLRDNFEFGGYIFVHPDGTYTYGFPVTDFKEDRVSTPNVDFCRPFNGWEVGKYHNHPFPTSFSEDDTSSASLINRYGGHRGWTTYLSSSDGAFSSYYPDVGWTNSVPGAFPRHAVELDEP